jgi:large subunit ribosomal protein L23
MARTILIRPLLTEKITSLMEKKNQYGFIVDFTANKIEIKKAVEEKFSVKVTTVNTIKHKGKVKAQMTKKGRFVGRTPKYKKAIITLVDGQKIDIVGEV